MDWLSVTASFVVWAFQIGELRSPAKLAQSRERDKFVKDRMYASAYVSKKYVLVSAELRGLLEMKSYFTSL